MTENDSFDSRPEDFAELIEATQQSSSDWGEEDLAGLFRHQLAASLEEELSEFEPRLLEMLRKFESTCQRPFTSFSDLLHSTQPPVELLQIVKRFAKQRGSASEGSLPKDVAAVIYSAAISAALVHLDTRITSLDEQWLQNNIHWASERPWIDADTRKLFETALAWLANQV